MCTFRFVASLGFRFRTQRRVPSWCKRHVSIGPTTLLVGSTARECEMVDSPLPIASSFENDTPSATVVVDFTSASIFVKGNGSRSLC